MRTLLKCNPKFLMLLLVIGIMFVTSCGGQKLMVQINEDLRSSSELMFEEDFNDNMENWTIEQMKGGKAGIIDGKLEINDASGCTIWYNKKLSGPIMIEYDAYIIKNGGTNDRVSDMNCFWMAKDMGNPEDIFENSAKRGGKFSNYDGLRLYYMGVGGHDNSKTRFRRYVGNGERPLLPEHDYTNPDFLLTANQPYQIRIIAFKNHIQYYRNGVLMVNLYDDKPYISGYFGFRTVNNHMTLDNFKVYKLSAKE